MTFTSYDAAVHTIDRANGLLLGAQPNLFRRSGSGGLFKRPSTVPADVRSDMRRLSIVMAVAALDTYMHRLILERAFDHDVLPRALAQLEIPFEALLAQADATRDAARAAPSNTRPRVGVQRQLQERLLRETFQNYGAVSRALKMAGRSKDWGPIGEKMSPPMSAPDIKARLDQVVHRRNQIVHEGDYERCRSPKGQSSTR